MLQLAVEQSAAPKRLDSAAAEIDESSGDGADRPERGLLGGAELTGRIRQPGVRRRWVERERLGRKPDSPEGAGESPLGVGRIPTHEEIHPGDLIAALKATGFILVAPDRLAPGRPPKSKRRTPHGS